MNEWTTDADVRRVLSEAKTVAVLGAHDRQTRPAHYVPAYLDAAGYRVIPVNVMKQDQTLWGEPVRARLDEIGEPVDIVDVFRAPRALMAHLPEILAMNPRPKLVWLQLGIRHQEFADALLAEGIEVVQDRCTMADHRRMGLGRQ